MKTLIAALLLVGLSLSAAPVAGVACPCADCCCEACACTQSCDC